MADSVSRDTILEALRTVIDPKTGDDIVTTRAVTGLVIKGGNIGFSIEVDPARGTELEPMRKQAETLVRSLPGVLSATVVLTAHNESPGSAPKGNGHSAEMTPNRPHIGGRVPGEGPEVKAGSAGLSPRARAEGQPGKAQNPQKIEGVDHIIAVASGKGGVGKSTTSVNLALGLAAQGLKVGLLDADIYGPSVPRLLNLKGKPTSPDGHSLAPMEAYDLKAMSIGFLIDEDTPMIWRGPMVMSALSQLLTDVNWAPLDVLVVDMPPGTGDAQLTMAQRVALSGAVIVSTPQDLALIDARKGLNMFRKTGVPVLGIIENMSTYVCPSCGHEEHLFGHGGAEATAKELDCDFLGAIPLHLSIRELSDAGTPITAVEPDGVHAAAYKTIASQVWDKLQAGPNKEAPSLSFE